MRTTWIRTGAGAAAAVLLLSTGGLHAASAGAPPATLPITVDPTTISDDTPFTVSGADCIDPDTQSGEGNVVVVEAPKLYYANPDDPSGTLYAFADVEPDGSWSVTTGPNTREEIYGPFDDFDTTVTAFCTNGDLSGSSFFQYGVVIVRYLGADPETTTTVPQLPVPTVQEPPAVPAPGGAAPATPVSGRATFTG